jgi:hypothetical protein
VPQENRFLAHAIAQSSIKLPEFELRQTASAVAFPNIAFTIFTLAKLGRTNRKVRYRAGCITGGSAFCGENQNKTDYLKANG